MKLGSKDDADVAHVWFGVIYLLCDGNAEVTTGALAHPVAVLNVAAAHLRAIPSTRCFNAALLLDRLVSQGGDSVALSLARLGCVPAALAAIRAMPSSASLAKSCAMIVYRGCLADDDVRSAAVRDGAIPLLATLGVHEAALEGASLVCVSVLCVLTDVASSEITVQHALCARRSMRFAPFQTKSKWQRMHACCWRTRSTSAKAAGSS